MVKYNNIILLKLELIDDVGRRKLITRVPCDCSYRRRQVHSVTLSGMN